MSQYEVAVIGGGAAGLSAALVLSRARRRVLVVDAGMPRNGPATHMHGYLSRDGTAPADLLAAGRHEVRRYGGDILDGTVTHLGPDDHGFSALLAGGERISARRLVVTTGLRDELPDIPGLQARWARDVLHCPYCHGYEVRDRRLGVLGGTPGAVRYAHIVRQWTHDLVYFTPPDVLTAAERTQLVARAISVVEGSVERLVIDDADHLRGVQMHEGGVIACDELFVPPRFVPNNTLLVGLGCGIDADGWVTVDATGLTSAPGVWRRKHRRPARASHHRRRRRFRGRHRHQRRPGRGGRAQRRPRPRPRHPVPTGHGRLPEGVSMTSPPPNPNPAPRAPLGSPGPPTKHQLALMIWLAVFPTLTVLNLVLAGWFGTLTPIVRTFVLATIAVPIVIYGLMPQLHRLRGRLLTRIASS